MGNLIRILAAEGDRVQQYFLQRAFREVELKAEVQYTSTGEQTMRQLRLDVRNGHRPDLLLLDLFIRRPDGFEVLEWINLQQGLRKLRTLALSASLIASDVARARALGACACLQKPGSPEDLIPLLLSLPGYCASAAGGRSRNGPRRLAPLEAPPSGLSFAKPPNGARLLAGRSFWRPEQEAGYGQ